MPLLFQFVLKAIGLLKKPRPILPFVYFRVTKAFFTLKGNPPAFAAYIKAVPL